MAHDPTFARPGHMLAVDPVLGAIGVTSQPAGGQAPALDATGRFPSSVLPATVSGRVASDGTVTDGTGFTVNKTGTGVYAITLNTDLGANALVIGIVDSSGSPGTVNVSSVTSSTFTIETWAMGSSVAKGDRAFNFVVVAA